MIKIIFSVRAKPGLTRAEALDHLRNRHGPLFRASTTNRQSFKTYIQNYAIDVAEVPKCHSDRDWIIDCWRDETVTLPEPPVAADAIAVREDEGRFPDRPTVLHQRTIEAPVWQADPDEPFAEAPIKVYSYFRRRPGQSDEAFEDAWSSQAAALAAHPRFREHSRGYIRNRVVPGALVTNPAIVRDPAKLRPFDGIDVWRFRDVDAVRRLFVDADFLRALDAFEAAVSDPADTFRLVTEEKVVFDDLGIDPGSRAEAGAPKP